MLLENILTGLVNLLSWDVLLFINVGLVLGIIFGALPGLTATMGVALFMPITFGMDPIVGITMLLGIYCGGIYGGSITAILIKTPGTPASAATVLDGYTLSQKGQAGKALHMALVASTIAGLFSALILLLVAPQLAKVALKFGPPEYFSLAIFGLTIIASVCSKNLFKGIMMGCLGMYVSMIGLDEIGGMPRFLFGTLNLAGGVKLIPALIGLFAISEILNKVKIGDFKTIEANKFVGGKVTWAELKFSLKTIFKSSAIGTFIGAVPGTGAAIASFLSYNEAIRSSKTPEKYGTGYLDGVAASEAGNNGVTGATLIPMLTLGIPGDTVTAVLLGALMMQGLQPGPALFRDFAPVVYTIMVSLIFVNIFMFIQGKAFVRIFANITKIPVNLLLPILMILCVTGAYAENNTMFDVWMMFIFGAGGYILIRNGFPVTPLLLARILGPMAEISMRQSLIMSQGSYSIFFTRPICLFFLVISVASILFAVLKKEKINALLEE
jgi:putative tricarboxylic transport membrane protein